MNDQERARIFFGRGLHGLLLFHGLVNVASELIYGAQPAAENDYVNFLFFVFIFSIPRLHARGWNRLEHRITIDSP